MQQPQIGGAGAKPVCGWGVSVSGLYMDNVIGVQLQELQVSGLAIIQIKEDMLDCKIWYCLALKALHCVDIVRHYLALESISGCKELNVDIFVVGEDWGAPPIISMQNPI